MKVHHDIDRFSARIPVVIVGIFDGVHLGHQHILEQLKKIAGSCGGETVIVTLWPHPRMVLDQEDMNFRMLNTREEKIRLLEEAGIQHMVILPFTREFSRLSSCDFIEKILAGSLGVKKLVIGYNHRFGRDREGDFEKLKKCADKFEFEIEKLDAFLLDERNVSSSGIRTLLSDGKVEEAGRLLGRPYSFTGQVVGGSKLGRSIGFPTANITPGDNHKLLPAGGVYAVEAELKDGTFRGMMNMGSRPTVNKDPDNKTIEVHLLNFEGNIYSENIEIRFMRRIRDEQRFESIEALKEQLQKDREMTMQVFQVKP